MSHIKLAIKMAFFDAMQEKLKQFQAEFRKEAARLGERS
jgi:hypothetical protein